MQNQKRKSSVRREGERGKGRRLASQLNECQRALTMARPGSTIPLTRTHTERKRHRERGGQIWAAAVRLLTMSVATVYGVVYGSSYCLPACLLLQLPLLLQALLLLSLWQSPPVASALCVIVSMEMNINAIWIVQSTNPPMPMVHAHCGCSLCPSLPWRLCLSSSRRHRPVWQSPLPAAAQCALCSALIFISGITSSSSSCCCYSSSCCCYCCCCHWRFPWLSNMFSIVFVCLFHCPALPFSLSYFNKETFNWAEENSWKSWRGNRYGNARK